MAKDTSIDFIVDYFQQNILTTSTQLQASTHTNRTLEPKKLFSDIDIDLESLDKNFNEPPITLDISKRADDSSQSDLGGDMNEEVKSKKRLASQASLDSPTLNNLDRIAKKPCLEKSEILDFLESVMEVDLSKDVLTDIVYKKDGSGKFTVVGRPKVMGSSTKQMRHVTPYSFVEKLITHMVSNATSQSDLFGKLSDAILLFLNDKIGFCFNNQDLKNISYTDISQKLKAQPEMVKKSLFDENNEYLFINTSYSKTLFGSPTKKDKAIEEFSIRNKEFIKASLTKLKSAIGEQEGNTLTIVSEALARYMFILFNQQKYAAFPKEGNTLDYEIRLYDSPEKAASPKKSSYRVMTSKEIKEDYFDTNKTNEIDKCIRIVNWEGAKTKEIYKGLVTLDNVIKKFNLFGDVAKTAIEGLLTTFNKNYNLELKLANAAPDLSKYNDNLSLGSYKETIAHQAAKLLYIIFDFKALEDNVFVPKIKKSIQVYNSASGTNTSKYSIQDGAIYRETEENKANGYNDKVIFRSIKTDSDSDILAKKAVEHIYISLMPFEGFYKGFTIGSLLKTSVENKSNGIIKEILNSFANLINLDYQLPQDQATSFHSLVNDNYNKAVAPPDLMSMAQDYDIKITGENFDF